MSSDETLSEFSRSIFEGNLRWLIKIVGNDELLFSELLKIHKQRNWVRGWQVIKESVNIYQDSKFKIEKSIYAKLCKLEKEMRPTNLISEIEAKVTGSKFRVWALDDQYDRSEPKWYENSLKRANEESAILGERFAKEGKNIEELGENLFELRSDGILKSFGQGLALGAEDKRLIWNELIKFVHKFDCSNLNSDVMSGYIEQIDQQNSALSRELLDTIATDKKLINYLVEMHPKGTFNENDFERCIKVLSQPQIYVSKFGRLLYDLEYTIMSDDKKIILIEKTPRS